MTRKRSAKSRAKRRAQAASGLAAAASRARGGNGDVREGDAVDADAGHDNKDSDSDAPQRHPALDYLQQWKHARESWKFQKNRQTYLLKHAFDSKKVPKSAFAILADYVRDLSGHARERFASPEPGHPNQRMAEATVATIEALRILQEQQDPAAVAVTPSADDIAASDAAADAAAHEQKVKRANRQAKRARILLKRLG